MLGVETGNKANTTSIVTSTHRHACTDTWMHMHARTHAHTHMHTHTHTHTHTCAQAEGLTPAADSWEKATLLEMSAEGRIVGVVGGEGEVDTWGEDHWTGGCEQVKGTQGASTGGGNRGSR